MITKDSKLADDISLLLRNKSTFRLGINLLRKLNYIINDEHVRFTFHNDLTFHIVNNEYFDIDFLKSIKGLRTYVNVNNIWCYIDFEN